jgi:hypothetical protein
MAQEESWDCPNTPSAKYANALLKISTIVNGWTMR